MMFLYQEESAVPQHTAWKMQDCCVLFLIIRRQGLNTEH